MGLCKSNVYSLCILDQSSSVPYINQSHLGRVFVFRLIIVEETKDFHLIGQESWASRVTQAVKNPLAIQETWVRLLLREEGVTTHSSILAWRILWTEEPGGLQSLRFAKSLTRLEQLSMPVCRALKWTKIWLTDHWFFSSRGTLKAQEKLWD